MYPLLLHGWRRWNDSEQAPGKGNLSYDRRAYGVKNKMARSAWKRLIYIGKAICSVSTSATRAVPRPHQPRLRLHISPESPSPLSDPHNPAPPRREACDSRSASLFSPEPPDAPEKTERCVARASSGVLENAGVFGGFGKKALQVCEATRA